MSERRARALLGGNVIRLVDVACRERASEPAADERATVTEVIVPLRGCFEVHRGGRDTTVADAASVVVFRAGQEYRVGHPASDGDDCFVLVLPPDVADDAIGSRAGGLVGPDVRLRVHRLRAALRRGAMDPLEAEEAALGVLEAIGRDSFLDVAADRRAAARRADAERVRTLLASRPGVRWRLDEIAREVYVSPAHLARRFRAATGESISRYLLRLRLGLALDRLAAGDRDLAALADELGFANHSHFTARFRSTFGITPSAFRDPLSSRSLDELRTFVTASHRSAS
ncbi:MAG TPA: helix-turn-helix transcriptional regulator [Actinomycetota bacterium]|nr:helix-turn-helix transcriptional regulator [Actinomycetota bacterium]